MLAASRYLALAWLTQNLPHNFVYRQSHDDRERWIHRSLSSPKLRNYCRICTIWPMYSSVT